MTDHTITLLGRYKLLAEIGRGAMGTVYLGHDNKIDRQVALKCIRPEVLEVSEETQKRFQSEILALGRLVHPNIVTIFDTGEDSVTGASYIVMEYVEGRSLHQILQDGTRFSLDQIVQIGLAICRALDFAHSKGVIHRDIKPGNILLNLEQRTVKVADFGIARLDGGGGYTQLHHLIGTPQYMSPEQCRGEPIDGRSDLFSVGVLLYELLTHQKPFFGDNVTAVMYQVLNKYPISPETRDSNIPKGLSDIVMKAMEKPPDRRFSTGGEMVEALTSLIIGQDGGVADTMVLSKSQGMASRVEGASPIKATLSVWPHWRRGVWVGTAAWIIVVIGGLFFALQKKPQGPTFLEAVSTPRIGIVDFTSTPIAANVLINGEIKGVTPFVLNLPAGSYELVLNKDGYYPLEATITVTAGERIPVALKLTEKERIP